MTHFTDFEENPWVEIAYEVTEFERKYGPNRGKMAKEARWTSKFSPPPYMGLEVLHVPSGKTKKSGKLWPGVHLKWPETEDEEEDYTGEPQLLWKHGTHKEKYMDEVLYPIADCRVRVEDKLLRKTQEIAKILKVGDFVKCVGTRSGDWNKVEVINKDTVYGQKFARPGKNPRYAASENGIPKIMKIVRDGELIYPLKK